MRGIRRRRIFVRAYPGESGRTVVDVGGLARSDVGGGFETEFAELSAGLGAAFHGTSGADRPVPVTATTPARGDDDPSPTTEETRSAETE